VFHSRAAATGKARSPMVERRVRGTTSDDVDAERTTAGFSCFYYDTYDFIPELFKKNLLYNIIPLFVNIWSNAPGLITMTTASPSLKTTPMHARCTLQRENATTRKLVVYWSEC